VSTPPPWSTLPATRPTPPVSEVCSGLTGHSEVVLVVFQPREIGFEALLHRFWEVHDPTQGTRQGNDVGTQYRSGIISPTIRRRPHRQAPSATRRGAYKGRSQGDYNRDPAGAGILLRGGLSPAVSGQESGRLLWSRRLPSGLSGLGRTALGHSGLIRPPVGVSVHGAPCSRPIRLDS